MIPSIMLEKSDVRQAGYGMGHHRGKASVRWLCLRLVLETRAHDRCAGDGECYDAAACGGRG